MINHKHVMRLNHTLVKIPDKHVSTDIDENLIHDFPNKEQASIKTFKSVFV